MGQYWSSIRRSFGFSRPIKVLLIGLDNAGKTTLLYRLQLGDVITTVPTIGFNMERFETRDFKFQAFDVGGQTAIRQFWSNYYRQVDVVLYIIDASDHERLGKNQEEILELLDNALLKKTLIGVLANKIDMRGAMRRETLRKSLESLPISSQSEWEVFETSMLNGEGLEEVMLWIIEKMKDRGVV